VKKNIFFILLLSLLFLKCEKEETYSEIPEIKYTEFNVIKGDGDFVIAYGILTFSFVDGDGDIGYLENMDTISDNNIEDILLIEYFKENGEYFELKRGPYHLPYFEEGVYRKHIKGKIDINLSRTILDSDTAYYEFYILDRAGHISNIEVTPEIIYSELLKQ
jgi:hypothetical protein